VVAFAGESRHSIVYVAADPDVNTWSLGNWELTPVYLASVLSEPDYPQESGNDDTTSNFQFINYRREFLWFVDVGQPFWNGLDVVDRSTSIPKAFIVNSSMLSKKLNNLPFLF